MAITASAPLSLTEVQISDFKERGFLCVDQITTPDEVELIGRVLERLFNERAGRKEGAQFDMVSHDEEEAPARLPAIINPANYARELRATQFRTNALAIARQLLGPTVTPAFEHAILKPARDGAETPWHQDEATRYDADFYYEQLSIWMPLCDVTMENGCMQYIARSHLGEVLPHRSLNNDPRIQTIECAEGFDPDEAISCPLPAGGAVIHHGRTLHHAGSNTTDRARFAYILAFELPPRPRTEHRDFSWNRNKTSANLVRKAEWRRRGGLIVELARKVRVGVWRSPRRLAFEVYRAVRAISKR